MFSWNIWQNPSGGLYTSVWVGMVRAPDELTALTIAADQFGISINLLTASVVVQ